MFIRKETIVPNQIRKTGCHCWLHRTSCPMKRRFRKKIAGSAVAGRRVVDFAAVVADCRLADFAAVAAVVRRLAGSAAVVGHSHCYCSHHFHTRKRIELPAGNHQQHLSIVLLTAGNHQQHLTIVLLSADNHQDSETDC